MGCFVILFAFISPRLALFFILLFSGGWVGDAFDGWVLPVLGFFLLPWTTLAYIVMWQMTPGVNGFEWFIVDPGLLCRPALVREDVRRTSVASLSLAHRPGQ